MPSTRIQQLYAIIQQHGMERKLVIAGNHAEGHQWLEQVSRHFGSVLNTDVRTLEGWVLDRSKLLLAKKGLRYLPNTESKWIICRLLQESAAAGSDYLSGIVHTPGLTDVFHQAIMDLRESCVKAANLETEMFEHAVKGAFIKELLNRYEGWLKGSGLVDWAGLNEILGQSVETADIIVIDEPLLQSRLNRMLVHKLTAGNYAILSNPADWTQSDSSFPFETAEYFHATGALAEVREVMRRIVERKIPLDQVEIITSDYVRGAAAIYTAAASVSVPCTFAEGLPNGITNAGKAAKLYIDWLESDFQLEPIITATKQGKIRLHDDGEGAAASAKIIRALEKSGIGWGKERYGLLAKQAQSDGIPAEDASVLFRLNEVFDSLLSPLDEMALSSPEKLIRELCRFIEKHGVLHSAGDKETAEMLRSLEQAMHIAGGLKMKPELALRYVREEVDRLMVMAAALPKPGHIHVSSLGSGAQTGRGYTFIIGMSEDSWSPSMRQDPVLLDEERIRISVDLPVSSETAMQRMRQRNSRLGMIRSQCTLSYCSYELSEKKEQMPAYELLQQFRRTTRQTDADYERLKHVMGDGVRYVRSAPGAAADALEVWMRALLGSGSKLASARRLLFHAYPWLLRGARALQAKQKAPVSEYDGIVNTDRYPMRVPGDAGVTSAFSASMLERYGRCPLQFFYQYTLGIRPRETVVYDRTVWLDASQRGSLLHDIFDRYIGSLKDASHQLHKLHEIIDEIIMLYAERVPSPSEHIFLKEAESIRRDAAVFFAYERQRMTLPVFTELQLHKDGEPLALRLSEEWNLPIRGFVDRVDEIAPHRYKIFDYKTGNPGKFRPNDCFSDGTQLQLPLYGLAVEQWMRETGYDREAQIVESAYVFPTERGMGEEVSRPQYRREELKDLVRAMTDSMKQGLFPPTSDSKNCTWCDYKEACGSQAEQFKAKRDAPENAAKLERLLEVQRFA
ncbi:PD-(D/E)XK nuclease family protein [Paenibacillus arenilitoris]|uniref:PD-(D/E)XK nuclease family protein n=1 Tax=Paenibacillus arenilitoris TaxID=2772299 RepID=A0A927H9E6_9BACL|nr:PD-(D/E)XK nuclease family protein [Paenibacillus arenilitoris]MBD2872552.1 PD-(D/E)XK nuclease family protein [Paenibacillus arenilitoris]